jgi:ABC-type nitrate/sulfonate/bicarbonate transport system permease component
VTATLEPTADDVDGSESTRASSFFPNIWAVISSLTFARVLSFIAFLGGWQLLAAVKDRVPTPRAVLDFLWVELSGGSHGGAANGEFIEHFIATLQRFLAGLAIAFVIGVAVGLLIGASVLARAMLNDTMLVLLALPAVIWAFLSRMWFGFSWKAPLVTVILSAIPFVVVNMAQGVRSIDPQLHSMSTAFGVPRAKRIWNIYIAGTLGYVFTGFRFAVIIGWNGVLLSEWFGSEEGVGFRSRYWYDAQRYRGFVGWVVLFVGFIVIVDRFVLARLQRHAFRWRASPVDKDKEPGTDELLGTA